MHRFPLRSWPMLVAAAALLAACAVNPGVRTVTTPDASLLFGYIDLKEAPYSLQTVFLTQNEKVGIVYRQSRMNTYTDGLFFMENLPPMEYHIPFFTAGNVTHVVSANEADLLTVPRSSIVFVGAWRYHDPKKGGILTTKKFQLLPTNRPSEAEVLRLLAERVQDPRWKERIARRLRELR